MGTMPRQTSGHQLDNGNLMRASLVQRQSGIEPSTDAGGCDKT
jgi:hypothetical protein